MLSILIPVFNYDVRLLIKSLHQQGINAGIDFEIIVMDDGSDGKFIAINEEISSHQFVKFISLGVNKGRSAIRNLLAEKASFPWLLFMDCDVMPESDQFIQNYVSSVEKNCVIYGGRSYSPDPPAEKEKYFHWYYGTNREVSPVRERQIHPYRSFMTNNFMIPADIYASVKMDENIKGYGHEDTLFGFELKKKKICIRHTDNPLRHIGLESADEFLEKTRNGIRNFYQLILNEKADGDSKLYRAYRLAKWTGTRKIIIRWYRKREDKIIVNLKSVNPSLMKFDIMKLALLLEEELNYADHEKNK